MDKVFRWITISIIGLTVIPGIYILVEVLFWITALLTG